MTKTYWITRESAAKILWISTRTIDRYIKSGKLSYKKVANKVLLAKEEIAELQSDFWALHQESTVELVKENSVAYSSSTNSTISPALEKSIDEKIDKFILIFNEKDKMIEEKNKVIFMLQQRVGELETKLKTMVALPDYTKEKQEALIEKQKLEEKIEELKWNVRTEKNRSVVFLAIALILIIVAIFVFLNK